ncbi:hypothetical protein [Ktedonobacter sp. SOSP1-52]|uniref:hypothetical protein n=1 Tax=Ktedonobacter sp. SOSP1-52 TaxID=2778366 RepID=UPI001915CF88|nr:hypothetical protein [Ktedonobacter sp. SOSP1-52]
MSTEMMMAAETVSARLPPPSQTVFLQTHSALNALPESGGFAAHHGVSLLHPTWLGSYR